MIIYIYIYTYIIYIHTYIIYIYTYTFTLYIYIHICTYYVYIYYIYIWMYIYFFLSISFIQVMRGASAKALGLQCDAGRWRVCLKVVGGEANSWSHWKSLEGSFLLEVHLSSEVALKVLGRNLRTCSTPFWSTFGCQEANYEQEAKNAQMFAKNFGQDPTVKIPKAGRWKVAGSRVTFRICCEVFMQYVSKKACTSEVDWRTRHHWNSWYLQYVKQCIHRFSQHHIVGKLSSVLNFRVFRFRCKVITMESSPWVIELCRRSIL